MSQIRTAKIVFYDEEDKAIAGYRVFPMMVEWEQKDNDPYTFRSLGTDQVHTLPNGRQIIMKIEALVDSVIAERKSAPSE